MLVSWWPPPGPTLSLRKPPRRRANVLRAVEGTRRAHARDVTAARGGAGRRALGGGGPPRRGGARGECARASAALPGSEPGGRPGAREGRESGAGLRRLSLRRLASRLLRLHCRQLSDRPARVRAAPVGLEALPVGPADLPSLWRGRRGGPARVPASVFGGVRAARPHAHLPSILASVSWAPWRTAHPGTSQAKRFQGGS